MIKQWYLLDKESLMLKKLTNIYSIKFTFGPHLFIEPKVALYGSEIFKNTDFYQLNIFETTPDSFRLSTIYKFKCKIF
jgi:hypothetical protein